MTPGSSDHFNGKTFFNPGRPGTPSFARVLQWRLTSRPALQQARAAAVLAPEAFRIIAPGESVTV